MTGRRGESVNAGSSMSRARSGHQPAHALGDSPEFTGRRTCPACGEKTLKVKRGIGGILLLCSNGCSRAAVIAALPVEDER